MRLGPRDMGARASYTPARRELSNVASDSVVNEARVGFLSHPKTMRPNARFVSLLSRLRLLHARARARARSAPSFVLSVACPPHPISRPLPVFCIRYRIPTTSGLRSRFSAAGLTVVPRRCRVAVKRTKDETSARAGAPIPPRR